MGPTLGKKKPLWGLGGGGGGGVRVVGGGGGGVGGGGGGGGGGGVGGGGWGVLREHRNVKSRCSRGELRAG